MSYRQLVGHPSIEDIQYACGRLVTRRGKDILSDKGKCREFKTAAFALHICHLSRNHVWGVYEWITTKVRYALTRNDVLRFCEKHPKLKVFVFKSTRKVCVKWLVPHA